MSCKDREYQIYDKVGKKLTEHRILGLIVYRKCSDLIKGEREHVMPVTYHDISVDYWGPIDKKDRPKIPNIRRIMNDLEKRGLVTVIGKKGKEKLYDLAIESDDFVEDLGDGKKILRFKVPKAFMVKVFCTLLLYINKGLSTLSVRPMLKSEGVDDEISNFICELLGELCGLKGYRLCKKCEFVKREQLTKDLKKNEQDIQTKMELLTTDLRTLLHEIAEHELFGGVSLQELKQNRNGIKNKLVELIHRNESSIRTAIEYERAREKAL